MFYCPWFSICIRRKETPVKTTISPTHLSKPPFLPHTCQNHHFSHTSVLNSHTFPLHTCSFHTCSFHTCTSINQIILTTLVIATPEVPDQSTPITTTTTTTTFTTTTTTTTTTIIIITTATNTTTTTTTTTYTYTYTYIFLEGGIGLLLFQDLD